MDLSRSTTVVLADDHAIVREGFAALCAAQGMQVLGQCADGRGALEMVLTLQPDFAILDLHMPGMDGAEVVRQLRTRGCAAKLIILSISREEDTVRRALRAGADAYLLKDGPARHLQDAVSFVGEGGVYVSPCCAAPDSSPNPKRGRPAIRWPSLSPRELEVFHQLVNGLRAKDIAKLLDISPKTVDTYRASLFRKLNVHDLVGLVKFAIDRGLTTT
jgi:DNA-binding NarL/FixJ family response regulator